MRYCPLNRDRKYNGEGALQTNLRKKKNVASKSILEEGKESFELQNEGSDEEIVDISSRESQVSQF